MSKFPLGRLFATPGAMEALEKAGQSASEFFARHARCDWGEVCEEDARLNDEALENGSRLLSAYKTKCGGTRLWVLTEAADDEGRRAATTILRPEEY